MDVIKKLKKNEVFKFNEYKTDHEEKTALWEKIEESIGNEKVHPLESYISNRMVLKIAAAVALLITVSWFFTNSDLMENEKAVADTDLTTITKSVKYGEKLTVTLVDGSIVKLNSGSELKYPERFDNDSREVVLIGEAFFQVSKNPNKPFIVKSGDVSTTVLGTSFNVNAYPEMSNIEVAVVTGKVKVESETKNSERKEVFLAPNDKATFSKENLNLDVSPFDLEEVIGWKDGNLVFRNASESAVLEKLERWYGVEFNVQNKSPKEWDLTTKFENNNLEYVLNVISYTAQFDYQIENEVVTLKY